MNITLLLLVGIILFNTFDVFATMIAIDRGVIEANPITQYIIENYGFGGLWATKMTLIAFLMVYIDKIEGGAS